ncbi:MAG: hypothetical protein WBC44_02760 [Planctomycetaceae bacterium]
MTLLAIHAGLLAYGATRHSPTLNEPGHLVAGLAMWEFGRFEVYRVNPPLTRLIAALPVLAAGYEMDWRRFYEGSGARPEFALGADFIKANGERAIWLFTIARWACIPISLLGGTFCFLWGRELYGTLADMSSPPIINGRSALALSTHQGSYPHSTISSGVFGDSLVLACLCPLTVVSFPRCCWCLALATGLLLPLNGYSQPPTPTADLGGPTAPPMPTAPREDSLGVSLPSPSPATDKPAPPVADADDGWIYANATAEDLVRQARHYDPMFTRQEQHDRDKAVGLYKQAIEAQPGAKVNAALANRIAQLYAFYENRKKGIRPDPDQAAMWWKRCLESTDTTQLLWAQAQMGLASTGVMRQTPESSLSPLNEILKLDPIKIKLDNWKESSYESSQWHRQELERLRQELRDLQVNVRDDAVPYAERLAAAKKKQLAQARATAPAWSDGRAILIGLNLVFVLVVGGLVAMARYRKSRKRTSVS